jgi:hypothetical protein
MNTPALFTYVAFVVCFIAHVATTREGEREHRLATGLSASPRWTRHVIHLDDSPENAAGYELLQSLSIAKELEVTEVHGKKLEVEASPSALPLLSQHFTLRPAVVRFFFLSFDSCLLLPIRSTT